MIQLTRIQHTWSKRATAPRDVRWRSWVVALFFAFGIQLTGRIFSVFCLLKCNKQETTEAIMCAELRLGNYLRNNGRVVWNSSVRFALLVTFRIFIKQNKTKSYITTGS